MLRLPKFHVATPTSVDDALTILAEHGEQAVLIAGGTDLVPNMKHELFTPDVVVSLARIPGLRGIRREGDGTLAIGAMTTIDALACDEKLRASAPALSQAAGLISGPQLRRMGTVGGNVMLDTRCQWYNQTHFWRQALGFCLKKDGSECFVVASGNRCVAAASNDTAPALMTLDATIVFQGPDGRREMAIDDLWQADGIYNKKVRGEILVEIRIPPRARGHHGAYAKLRDRASIDFPLLGLAVRLDLDEGTVADADLCAVALQARPVHLVRAAEALRGAKAGTNAFEQAAKRAAALAHKQCHPLPNIPGDHDYRREMVPVLVRRAVRAAARDAGPISL